MKGNLKSAAVLLVLAVVVPLFSQCSTATTASKATATAANTAKAAAVQPAVLKVGDKAPDFTLPDQFGKDISLSQFRGKKNVVLAFYVLAFTGG